ncbi:MAG: hypothetical protein ACI8ZN_002301 [Bacteroidia bacterium]|jgi:hypothetical protein
MSKEVISIQPTFGGRGFNFKLFRIAQNAKAFHSILKALEGFGVFERFGFNFSAKKPKSREK